MHPESEPEAKAKKAKAKAAAPRGARRNMWLPTDRPTNANSDEMASPLVPTATSISACFAHMSI